VVDAHRVLHAAPIGDVRAPAGPGMEHVQGSAVAARRRRRRGRRGDADAQRRGDRRREDQYLLHLILLLGQEWSDRLVPKTRGLSLVRGLVVPANDDLPAGTTRPRTRERPLVFGTSR